MPHRSLLATRRGTLTGRASHGPSLLRSHGTIQTEDRRTAPVTCGSSPTPPPRPSPGSCSKADSKRTSSRQPRSGATHSHPDGDEATRQISQGRQAQEHSGREQFSNVELVLRANDPTTSSGQPGRGQGVHRMPGACSRADRPTSIVPRSVHVRDQDVQPR
jgi:hypothetical protein